LSILKYRHPKMPVFIPLLGKGQSNCYLTLTLTSTDMPGSNSIESSGWLIMILTGTRWVVLVKSPMVNGGGTILAATWVTRPLKGWRG